MFRPMIGVKVTAVAIGIVATAGVAAAATITPTPEAKVAVVAPRVEADLPAVPTSLPGLPDLTEVVDSIVPNLPSVPSTPSVPSLPSLPSLPTVPGLADLPFDPGALPADVGEVVDEVVALLPTPEELRAVVQGCVSDLTALLPVPAPSVGNPLGGVLGLLGMFGNLGGSMPAMPDPAAVQDAVADCVESVLGLLPDPGALAGAITAAFGGSLPAPFGTVVDLLMGHIGGGLPDPQELLDLVTTLTSATGSPTAVLHQLTAVLEDVLPPQVAGLLALPLSIVDQVFAALGLHA